MEIVIELDQEGLPDEQVNDEQDEAEGDEEDQPSSHVSGVEVSEGHLERFLEIDYGCLTVLLLEVVDIMGHWQVQNVVEVVLLIAT